MKSFLKKLHIGSNQSVDSEDSTTSSKGNKLIDVSSTERVSQKWSRRSSELKPFSAIQGWLNSVTHRNIPRSLSSSNLGKEEKMEPSDSVSSSALEAALEAVRRDSENSNDRDPDIEEYQIQLALELSAKEDPEAVQIEAIKQISLGSSAIENTPAEVVAYRYWNYNSLGYDDKILDGFYDLYGIFLEPALSTLPSLVDLQRTAVSDDISWEAILVNRSGDSKLLNIEQKALDTILKSRTVLMNNPGSCLVKDIATLVSDHMGGPVKDPDSMLMAWKSFSFKLKASLGSMVLPLGSLKIGLARHRALLFKVLADSVGIPCRLVKGQQYTGSDDVAVNFVKIGDGREYIVDLMADPGTLIPSDPAAGHVDYGEPFFSLIPLSRGADSSHVASSRSEVASPFEENSDLGGDKHSASRNESSSQSDYTPHGNAPQTIQAEEGSKLSSHNFKKPHYPKKDSSQGIPHKTSHPYSHVRSPSWTEGVSSPAVRRMKVKDVSQYMIDAAKENPQLAQKLHDVLLESGVAAPPNLFTEIYNDESDNLALDTTSPREDMEIEDRDKSKRKEARDDHDQQHLLPPLPHHGIRFKVQHGRGRQQNLREATEEHVLLESDSSPVKHTKNVPVAAAVAAAAVVASSMVVAAAKTGGDSNIEIPVAAAATATAAAVVVTTAATSKQYENLESSPYLRDSTMALLKPLKDTKIDKENEVIGRDQRGSGEKDHENWGTISDGERISDRSTGSTKSDTTFDDVADCEIPYEDITLGERIGIGSYGEVYHGDWHGTEVAVKRFLDQGITSESLEEFKSEVRIMKRTRHPNVVLFMGAITHPPNLSIITEFLPRGSLYRLLHRPNNQLDERRRLRMAFDAARGMNYLHNSTPVIVHRDLKTPNLLVDKNWVVKVCDFGLSRIKHNTYLSSRSTAGTAEWMAPEVLRNEPSDEKCDVYSFGVILWELCTLQQPWGGMNPMQVVGAVGFQHRRLEIPDNMDPTIADLIERCWQTDPKSRPSFAEIMAILKPLQKPITVSQIPRPSAQASRGQSSRLSEDSGGQR